MCAYCFGAVVFTLKARGSLLGLRRRRTCETSWSKGPERSVLAGLFQLACAGHGMLTLEAQFRGVQLYGRHLACLIAKLSFVSCVGTFDKLL